MFNSLLSSPRSKHSQPLESSLQTLDLSLPIAFIRFAAWRDSHWKMPRSKEGKKQSRAEAPKRLRLSLGHPPLQAAKLQKRTVKHSCYTVASSAVGAVLPQGFNTSAEEASSQSCVGPRIPLQTGLPTRTKCLELLKWFIWLIVLDLQEHSVSFCSAPVTSSWKMTSPQ